MPLQSSRSSRELAAAAGRDHRDFLLELIGPAAPHRSDDPCSDTWNHGESPKRYPVDTGRLRRVIEIATREAGWGRKLRKGARTGARRALQFCELRGGRCRGRGERQGRVDAFRAWTSPLTVARRSIRNACARNCEGAVVMGVEPCDVWARSRFKDGRVQQDNFNHTV